MKETKAQRLKWAKDYLDYCYHMGMDEADYEYMSDKEIIEMATTMQDKAEMAYDSWKEQDI